MSASHWDCDTQPLGLHGMPNDGRKHCVLAAASASHLSECPAVATRLFYGKNVEILDLYAVIRGNNPHALWL